ncbi:DMT family transporter [Pseudoprimorskyibacter insulae]|uniref:Riboflavin transporter n=1 Tax=Pseudoprimorskyibacter insulae TaxID=1695997 RepID=A0A2R8APW6_9RHOB|nr:DMT family transporter [Pseudoprimorskyibacter insulae]SPF78020.1 Riboflavin transporter [Pseudoprimorskyibacter insulae]
MVVAPRQDKTALGVWIMILAVGFFVCIDTSAKWLSAGGMAAMQIVFCRYFVHFALSLAVYLPTEGTEALKSNAPVKQFLRSLFLLGSTSFNFLALQHLPITLTTTIMFAGPIVVTLVSIPLLGERVGIHRIFAVCVGFGGVLVVMQPWGAEFDPAMIYSLIALTSASLYMVMTRMLAGVESNATSQLWSSGLAMIAVAPFAAKVWVWPDAPFTYGIMVAIGCFGAVGHILATYAHRLAEASILAPTVYAQLLFAAIAGIFVFGTWPTPWTFGGGLIIMASGLYIWWRERTKGRPATVPDPRRAPHE